MTVKAKSNKIQEELKEVTKQNYTTTKINYKVMWVLTAIIALSAIAAFYCNYFLNKTVRYAISSASKNIAFVLDTKTSQLWVRTTSKNVYLGTNENPMLEQIFRRVKVPTFEEIGIKSETSKNNK